MATYEFISLKRVSQAEIGGDESLVEYLGGQLFSQAGFQGRSTTGRAVVNWEAQLAELGRANLLEAPGAHPVEGGEELLNKVDSGVDGLTCQAF